MRFWFNLLPSSCKIGLKYGTASFRMFQYRQQHETRRCRRSRVVNCNTNTCCEILLFCFFFPVRFFGQFTWDLLCCSLFIPSSNNIQPTKHSSITVKSGTSFPYPHRKKATNHILYFRQTYINSNDAPDSTVSLHRSIETTDRATIVAIERNWF